LMYEISFRLYSFALIDSEDIAVLVESPPGHCH
jgi:hypothetical protein